MSTEMHVLTNWYNGHRLVRYISVIDPFPSYTLRLRFTEGHTPTNSKGTLTQVSASPNVWDWTYNNTNWSNAWYDYGNTLLEVIDNNTSNVTNMESLFQGCTALTSVPLFDTSNVMNMSYMFSDCSSLTSVPLFDTSKVTNMSYMFYGCAITSVPLFDTSKVTNMRCMFYQCLKVASGALALYQQASTQTNPPTNHKSTFYNCGRDTVTGAAELAQIPSDWK